MGHERVTGTTVNRPLPPGIDRLPSGLLRVRVYGPDGKRVTVGTYTTEGAAKDALALARSDLLRGSYIERKRGEITLDAWIAEWMPGRSVRPNTLAADQRRYRLHIKPYLATLPLVKITPYQVGRWMTQLERDGRSIAMRKKAHTLLKTALGLHGAVGDERIPSNPCAVVRAPLPDRPDWTLLTRSQFEDLYKVTPAWFQPCALLAAFAGLRWSEIAGLHRSDYNRKTGALTVRRGVTYIPKQGLRVDDTKNRRRRTVPLTPRLQAALDTHLKGPAAVDGWMFHRGGQPLAPYHAANAWRRAVTDSGLPCRFHDLRHSCASWLLDGGATLAEVRDLLGHSSVTVTELYLHVDRSTLAATVLRALR